MNDADRLIRVGRINYTNVWPVFYYFPPVNLNHKMSVVRQVPSQLNKAMLNGEIDIAPISSFAYGESFENYLLFPDLSVSAYGKVNSILLFYKEPFDKLLFGRVALTATSATSVNLLKIILEKFYGGKPNYRVYPPSLEEMMRESDAALLIGDDAIKASMQANYPFIDLGEAWFKKTGHWMTFAVWAIRREIAERQPQLLSDIYLAFQQSKLRGLQLPDEMITDAANRCGGNKKYWHRYFSQLRYDFGPAQWDGLQKYFDYALEMGLISKAVQIQIWNEKIVR